MKIDLFKVAAFYSFIGLSDLLKLKREFTEFLKNQDIRGTMLIASEGINGTLAGKESSINEFKIFLKSKNLYEPKNFKTSHCEYDPFPRLKIKLKDEIVTIGNKSVDPKKIVGEYIPPEDWNQLIADKEVMVLDTRNIYEHSIGSFKNAIQPETTNFREFSLWLYRVEASGLDKNKKVAMFCTGGIRCEKASSLMKSKGFENIYHLQGGILNYLEKINEEDSLWKGECFVFDDRVAINHKLQVGSYGMCHGCRMPITESDKNSEHYKRGISCPNCFNKKTPAQKKRYAERQRQVDLAKLRNEKHIGGNFILNKK